MCHALRRDRLPDRRIFVGFDFTGRKVPEEYWLLIEGGDAEICKTYRGLTRTRWSPKRPWLS